TEAVATWARVTAVRCWSGQSGESWLPRPPSGRARRSQKAGGETLAGGTAGGFGCPPKPAPGRARRTHDDACRKLSSAVPATIGGIGADEGQKRLLLPLGHSS